MNSFLILIPPSFKPNDFLWFVLCLLNTFCWSNFGVHLIFEIATKNVEIKVCILMGTFYGQIFRNVFPKDCVKFNASDLFSFSFLSPVFSFRFILFNELIRTEFSLFFWKYPSSFLAEFLIFFLAFLHFKNQISEKFF